MSTMQRKNRLKILYITREGFPTFRVDIKTLFGKYLPRHGIDTSIIAYENNEPLYEWPYGQIFTYSAHINSITGKITDLFRNIYLTWKLSPEYDAIQVRDKAFIALALIPLAKLRKRPIFFWMSFPFPEDDLAKQGENKTKSNYLKKISWRLRGKLMSFVQYKLVFRAVDHVFVQSSAMRQYVSKKYCIPEETMTVVPMGIDMETVVDFLQNDSPSPYNDGEFIIASLGLLTSFRGPDFVLDIFKQLARNYPQIRLIIIGGSINVKELKDLEEKIHRRGLENIVRVTGWLEQSEAWRFAKHAHLGINLLERSVLSDTMSPTKIMEYAALGVPSLVTDIPDQEQVVNQCKCGVCVPYDKVKITSAIIELLQHPEKRETLSKNGKRRIGKYRGYDKIATQLAEVYQKKLQRVSIKTT